MKFIFVFLLGGGAFWGSSSLAQVPSMDLQASQVSFDYLSSDGAFWYDCTTIKNKQPHSFTAVCGLYTFTLHMMLMQYLRSDETTYEFHYWATEDLLLKQSQTQSTWLTVDKAAKVKDVLGYLGFQDDSSQLRIHLNLKPTKPGPP
jgi:hypothetical protein